MTEPPSKSSLVRFTLDNPGEPGIEAPATVPRLSAESFEYVKQFAARHLGICLRPGKHMFVLARLAPRLRVLGLRSFESYVEYIERPEAADERQRLLEALCTHESSFFREPWQFEFLEKELLPAWAARAARGERSRSLRIWSAGCSTGEEPYTLAMCLCAKLPNFAQWDIQILATDVSTQVLDTARAGIFPADALEATPSAYADKFLLRGENSRAGLVKVARNARQLVTFQQLNLHQDAFPKDAAFDLILCRNVLIYFAVEQRTAILEKFARCLDPGAHLFLGHSERILGLSDLFQNVIPCVYKRVAKKAPNG